MLCWLSGHESTVSRHTGSQVSCWCWTGLLLWIWRIPVRVELYNNDADKREDKDKAWSVPSPVFCVRTRSQDGRLVCSVLLLLCGCDCVCVYNISELNGMLMTMSSVCMWSTQPGHPSVGRRNEYQQSWDVNRHTSMYVWRQFILISSWVVNFVNKNDDWHIWVTQLSQLHYTRFLCINCIASHIVL